MRVVKRNPYEHPEKEVSIEEEEAYEAERADREYDDWKERNM